MAIPGQITVGTSGPDVIIGTNGPDDIRAKGGNDKICSRGGNDIVRGGGGDDKINLGSGDDVGRGGKGDDLIKGKKGRDDLYGNGGRDTLVGGSNADRLWGGGNVDILKGSGGADALRGGKGPDLCFGGKGTDSLFSCNEDLNRILAAAQTLNTAASQGDGAAALAAGSYPVGEWTVAALSCANSDQLGINQSSTKPDPGWVLPDVGQPGGGAVPDGRIYSFKGSFGVHRAHATIIGGSAYFFPTCTVPPNPGDTKNCGDFATYADAKQWFDTYFPFYGDVGQLDANDDGIPCEGLPGAP